MKKVKKVLILALVLCVLMCVSVFAADTTIDEVNLTSGTLNTENKAKDQIQFSLSYSGEDGDMYLIMVLNSELEENEAPTASDILYVNQETVEEGKATFDTVYPTEIKDSVIYLAGGNLGKLTQIGEIKANAPAYNVQKIGKNNAAEYLFTNNNKTLNVVNSVAACAIGYTVDNGISYTKLSVTAAANGYDVDMTSVPSGAKIVIVVKGDLSGDGAIKPGDATQTLRASNGKELSALQMLAADLNGDGRVRPGEATQVLRAANGRMIAW